MLFQISDRWGPAGRDGTGTADSLPFGRAASLRSTVPPQVEIRSARIGDMRQVEPLIQAFASDNLMLPKSFDQLVRSFREFVVATAEGGQIIGCGALRIYSEGLAEICSLAVDQPFQGLGVGRRLVEQLIEEADRLELKTVFALTLKADFFERLGFKVVPKDNFPLKVWADCRSCPKLHACDEVAVAVDVSTRTVPADGRAPGGTL